MTKESPRPPKAEKKKMTKEEKKEEKRRKKELKKSRESLADVGSGEIEPTTPKLKKKDKKGSSPGRDSQCSTGKKKGLFKRIGSFMLPAPALAPGSPTAQEERINTSQSCQDLGKSPTSPPRGRLGSPSARGLASNSVSSPNLYASPPSSPPPPIPVQYTHPTPRLNSEFPVTTKHRSFEEELDNTFRSSDYKISDYKTIVCTVSNNNEIACRVRSSSERTYDFEESESRDDNEEEESRDLLEENDLSCIVADVGEVREVTTEMKVVEMEPGARDQLRSDSVISVEYSVPVKYLQTTPTFQQPYSSEEDPGSPRQSSMKSTPSPRKDRRISFAKEDDLEFRVVTPEILKRDLAATLGVPPPPPSRTADTSYLSDVIDLPESRDLEGLPVEEKCKEQSRLLSVYEEKILLFRDQALEIVSDNARLKKLVAQQSAQDIETVQKQAQQVLQENRTLMKEQQMNESRWQELIEERNQEVARMRATCTNMEEQNTTLLKRCEKLEGRNEEIREAYNNIVTQADDFVPVSAHLSSMEGYKVALEELRKRYSDNMHDKEEELEGLEKTVSQLTERVEVLEEERSLLVGQVKGLKEALDKAQHSSTRHKRETVQLTERVNALKVSLAQAINIAEQSTLHKLELAEISDLQEKQKRSHQKVNTDSRVKEVKKIANAKLKSCAEILQEREAEHEKSISKLNNRISKLKSRCQNKDEIIQTLTHSDRTNSNSPDSA